MSTFICPPVIANPSINCAGIHDPGAALDQPFQASLQVSGKTFLSEFKVLVQRRYPGQPRNQGVAHGPLSPLECDGTRGIESHVGGWVQSPSHCPGTEASPEYPVARAHPPLDLAGNLSGGAGPSTR